MYHQIIVRDKEYTKFAIATTLKFYYDTLQDCPEAIITATETLWEAYSYMNANLHDYELLLGAGVTDASDLDTNLVYTVSFM